MGSFLSWRQLLALRASNKTPARRVYQASALLLRPHDATNFLELVAHRPNGAIRDVGRIGKLFATYHE